MKLGRATIYFYNFEDDASSTLEYILDRSDMNVELFNIEEVEIGEWYDEIDLNNRCEIEDEQTFIKYFENRQRMIVGVSCAVADILSTTMYTKITFNKALFMVLEEFDSNNENDTVLYPEEIEEVRILSNRILGSWGINK